MTFDKAADLFFLTKCSSSRTCLELLNPLDCSSRNNRDGSGSWSVRKQIGDGPHKFNLSSNLPDGRSSAGPCICARRPAVAPSSVCCSTCCSQCRFHSTFLFVPLLSRARTSLSSIEIIPVCAHLIISYPKTSRITKHPQKYVAK